MREVISIVGATLAVTLVDQFWYPEASGRFTEFVAMFIGSIFIVAVAFLLFVVPPFIWLRRSHRRISWHTGFIVGFVLGVLAILLMMPLFQWPFRIPLMVAGSVAGAIGVSIYARLTFKRVA
jgi:hypothetical protein